MMDAYTECNLVQVDLSNKVPNLWLDELFTIDLVAGQSTYQLSPTLVAFQAPVVTTTYSDSEVAYDRLLYAYSTYEYAAIPNKAQQGPPTSYWLNLLATPEVSFWPTPDSNAQYTFRVRQLRQIQDAVLAGGVTADVPYRWLDCYVAKLAHRFARIYAPDKEQIREADAEKAWAVAALTDQEQVPMYIQGCYQGYWQ